MEKERPVKLHNLIAYGVGDIFGGGSFALISMLFIFFLTDVIGLPGTIAGMVVMIGKAWDAVFDPVMGYITDSTRTRFGRRRIYFLIGALPIAITFSMLWMPVPFKSELLTTAYFALSYLLFSSTFSFVMVPYAALNAEMSRDYRIRTKLSGARMFFAGAATLVAGILPKLIIEAFHDPKQGFPVMGVIFGLFFALPWLAVFFGTWEYSDLSERVKTSLADFFRHMLSIFINRSFRLHLGMYICAYSALDVMLATVVYYMTYFFQRKELFSYCLGSMIFIQIGALIVYVAIANRIGKGVAYIIGLSIWGVAMVAGFFVSSDASNWVIIGLFLFTGSGMAAGQVMPWAILPSVTDVDELITTKQRAGVYAGSMAFMRKLIQAVVLFGVGTALELIGYVPNTTQAPETLHNLKLLFNLAPLSFILIGILFALRFKITPQAHHVLTEEIARLKSGGDKAQVSADTKAICESLTGLPYDRLYIAR